MLTSHKATIEMLTTTNAKVLENATKEIQASENTISETTTKVEKLSHEVTTFMAEFRISSDRNTEPMNKVIVGFHTSLQVEK